MCKILCYITGVPKGTVPRQLNMNNPAIAYLKALQDVGQETVSIQSETLIALLEALQELREDDGEPERIETDMPLADAVYCATCDVEFELEKGMTNLVKLAKELPKRVTLPGEPS